MAIAPRYDEAAQQGPSGVPEGYAQPRERLIALTRDAQLLDTLRLVATSHAISPVEAEDALATHLIHDHGGVALIDAAAITSSLASLTAKLKEQFPDLVLVVAGDAADQTAVAAQITDGTVYRFLHKPVSEQRVSLFVAAAWRRHGEEHAGIVGLAQTRPVPVLPKVHGRRLPRTATLAAAIAAVAIAAVTMNREQSKSPPAPPTVPAPAQPPSSVTAVEVPSTVAVPVPVPGVDAQPVPPVTREVTREPVVGAPAPSVQAQRTPVVAVPADEPVSQVETDDAPPELAPGIVMEARDAIAAGRTDEGERLLQLAAQAGASTEDLDILVRDIREARIAAKAGAMTRFSQLFNDRLRQGHILEPDADSARHYLAELQRTDAGHPSTRLARQALASRLLDGVRIAIDGDDLAAARRWLAEARDAGANLDALAAAETRIMAAAAARDKPDEVVPSTALRKIHHEDPRYPAAALKREINGWVDLVYVVRPDGTVGDIVVTRAEPAGVFDSAAADAVSQWRYQPMLRDGRAMEQRTSVRIRFQLE